MANDLLYVSLKNDIMRKIYEGIYEDGEAIPAERILADQYNMSRVTVRKALDLLEKDGIIRRTLGKGTTVCLNRQSYNSGLDIIALVAPAQRRFFATFIDYFQKIADKHNSLVVFIQQSEHESIKDTLFKLLQKNIHNVVIWLDYEVLNTKYIQRLRGLGMNIVFFDITVNSPYADCVCLDNRDAIYSLYQYVMEKKNKSVVYVTRENTSPSSYQERNQTFKEISPLGIVWNFPWDFKNYLANRTEDFIFDHLCPTYKPGSVICSDGELGIAIKKALISHKITDVLLVSLDDFAECAELGVTVYKQPFDLFAEKIFYCLMEQNFDNLNWKASMYRIKGELVIR
jgi:DNA-binding LacI/PurR family transcriptional regulator